MNGLPKSEFTLDQRDQIIKSQQEEITELRELLFNSMQVIDIANDMILKLREVAKCPEKKSSIFACLRNYALSLLPWRKKIIVPSVTK